MAKEKLRFTAVPGIIAVFVRFCSRSKSLFQGLRGSERKLNQAGNRYKRPSRRALKHTGTPDTPATPARQWAIKRPDSAAIFFGAAPAAARPWTFFLLFLWFLSAAILTTLGFFFDSVPFWLAWTPFLMALITPSRWHRAALVAGHFAIVCSATITLAGSDNHLGRWG